MAKEKMQIGADGIYDARQLGIPKMLILGFQHMFAMFGATVLVPLLTGLDVATTLLMAGLGTLLFHVITGFKVPAFLGSSFAFLGGYGAIAPLAGNGDMTNAQLLPYACLGVACAGIVYLILAGLIKLVGAQKVMRFFPPVVTGPIIIAIGLGLAGSAVGNCQSNWLIALIALVIVIVFNIWGKGMAKIVPILLGVVGSCVIAALLALICGETITAADGAQYITIAGNESLKLFSVSALENFKSAAWIGFPIKWNQTVFGGVDWSNTSLVISAIVAIMPISLATMMEHIGDISAIGSTVGKNFIADPGLHRTLTGDGLATAIASLFGGPANTTYGENTGVLALSRVYDPRVIRIAAVIAAVLSFSPKFAALVNLIPTAVIGGISFMLYGMISAIGVRNVVENQVDFTKSRNLIIAAVILVCALGLGSVSFGIGGLTITLSALACASIAGIVLNAVLPGNDYEFGTNKDGVEAVNFQMKADHKDVNDK
ncbi:MAG: uracil-xanthine permease [Ruminococcaceae bacterium]|nr:uracil-xanthine permease [Oscillospiraceae bacterium]